MNNTVTWQIIVQPWQISPMVTVRLSKASYNNHGRQLWETLTQHECRPDQLEEEIHELTTRIMTMEAKWRSTRVRVDDPL